MHLSEVYERMGGKVVLQRLVDCFYDLMDEDPDYFAIRKLHPQELCSSRQKLFMFLSGWTGGPSLYIEKYGEPRLRSRHLPFPIGSVERDQWLSCMNRAMDIIGLDLQLKKSLATAFAQTADFMRNQSE
ncbi:MAG: hemoglobin-like protein [Nitrosomonadaceae bacterium]|nr:hemoglobin-like protein [Nitrosomonadaceae bacterium]|tara:strand:- start:513 stop:899 length:387 start_codon:yes stop_codon:yes gene_type:complete